MLHVLKNGQLQQCGHNLRNLTHEPDTLIHGLGWFQIGYKVYHQVGIRILAEKERGGSLEEKSGGRGS